MTSQNRSYGRQLPRELLRQSELLSDGCLVWTGGINNKGYGYLWFEGRPWLVSRLAYRIAFGSVPADLDLHHRCRVKLCFEPTHLEPVTNEENSRRREAFWNANDPRCPQGHLYSDENSYRCPRGWLRCRSCDRERHRRRVDDSHAQAVSA